MAQIRSEAAQLQCSLNHLGEVIRQNYTALGIEGSKDDWDKRDTSDYLILHSKVTMLYESHFNKDQNEYIRWVGEMVIHLVSIARQFDMNLGAEILSQIENDHRDVEAKKKKNL